MTDLGNYEFVGVFALFLLICAWLWRGILTGRKKFYWYMVWNIVLASVPVLAILAIHSFGGKSLFTDISISAIWLLFLPNIFYLLTDFLHLNPEVLVNKRGDKAEINARYVRGDAWYIVDSFLLFVTAVFATGVGGFALEEYNSFLNEHYPFALAVVLMPLIIVLCAVGLYIGRFGRWNSWDAFVRPHAILRDLGAMLRSSKERNRLWIVTLTIVTFEIFSWALYSFFTR